MRQLTPEDWKQVARYIKSSKWNKRNNFWKSIVDTEVALNNLKESPSTIVAEQFFVSFFFYLPWFSQKKMLQEQCIWSIYPGTATIADVFKELEQIAFTTDSAGVCTGSLIANDEAMRRLYNRHGYTQVSKEFVKLL